MDWSSYHGLSRSICLDGSSIITRRLNPPNQFIEAFANKALVPWTIARGESYRWEMKHEVVELVEDGYITTHKQVCGVCAGPLCTCAQVICLVRDERP